MISFLHKMYLSCRIRQNIIFCGIEKHYLHSIGRGVIVVLLGIQYEVSIVCRSLYFKISKIKKSDSHVERKRSYLSLKSGKTVSDLTLQFSFWFPVQSELKAPLWSAVMVECSGRHSAGTLKQLPVDGSTVPLQHF